MTPVIANYSLMVILIEKLIREMNLDIYRVIEFIFSSKIYKAWHIQVSGGNSSVPQISV